MKNWLCRIHLMLLGICLAGATTVVAHADDDDASISLRHVGLRCIEKRGTTGGYYDGVTIQNDSGSTAMPTYCPVDIQRSIALWSAPVLVTHTTNSNHDWTAVVDANNSGNISCELKVCARDFTSCDSGTSDTSSGTGVQTLSGSTSTVGSDDNIMYLYCVLPVKSGSDRAELRSYQVESF